MNRSAGWIFLFKRDFESLRKELNAFEPETAIWKKAPGISNPAGNLCLHLCGNLRHYIGAVLGNSGYVRTRDDEFRLKNIPRNELIQLTLVTENEMVISFNQLSGQQYEQEFPIEVLNRKWITETLLIHLYGHFQYHLGQINYLRRFLMV